MVPDQHKQTWMLFVDGENFTMRAQAILQDRQIELQEGAHFRRDTFIWIPQRSAQCLFGTYYPPVESWAVRASYYTSVVGDENALQQIRDNLRDLHFSAYVFKKKRQQIKAKGVDIALTKDVLRHGFMGHYESVVLVSGDGDYVPLVEEVQRLGKRVIVWFFKGEGMNPELKRTADDFFDLTDNLVSGWNSQPNFR